MEKSSVNIKHFWNIFTRGERSYTLPRDNSSEGDGKFANGSIINNVTNCSAENIYSMRYRKSQINEDNGCDKTRVRSYMDENFNKCHRIYNNNFCLPIFTPISCSICMIIVIAALFGTSWISTEEKIPLSQLDASSFFYHSSNITVSYIIKSSNASLWIICTRLVAIGENQAASNFGIKNCTRIDHFDLEKYQPDPLTNESANVIPYTIILSLPILIVSFVILMISYMLFLVAICASKKYKIFYFVAGIGFIISGLVMLLGLIMFISIFKSEIYHKLRAPSLEPLFTFQYGHSFMMYVIGFMFVELAGMLNVCFFNKLQKEVDIFNQNHTLNNMMTIKHDQVDISNNHPTPRMAFSMANGFVPYPGRNHENICAYDSSKMNNSFRSNIHRLNYPQSHHHDAFHQVIFTRNASTSTLDLDNELNYSGDEAIQKNCRSIGESTKNRKGGTHNRLDFNNICGINVRLNKSKQCNPNLNVQQRQRVKPTRNIYYIKDKNDSCEPNIFIVDPRFHKNRKCALQKSLEDITMHNSHVRHHHHHDSCMNNMRMMERSVKTLPRDFSRPKCRSRPSLENFLDNFSYENSGENVIENRIHQSQNNLCSGYYHTLENLHHFKSADELSTQKSCRNSSCEKSRTIPKSPSSCSMNSYRLKRHPSSCDESPRQHKIIEEFDLERIERERRKSHTDLFEKQHRSELNLNFGTAV